jgi:predicted dehydrogenase
MASVTQPVRVGIVGCGGMARYHLNNMLKDVEGTRITAICEPSSEAYAAAAQMFTAAGLEAPPNQPDWTQFLNDYRDKMDAVLIVTPHVYHHDQTKACLEAGLDVLLEKPMVMNAEEARSLIETRDRTGRLLVVAFPGSLSPQIRTAVKMLRSGELGSILNISAMVWQDWNRGTVGTWRQQPELAGGGFLFDTGAHMLNTVADLAGENFVEVSALMDNRGREVDILSVVIGRLESGALVTMNACGEAPGIGSNIHVFCTKGVLRTGIWGEHFAVQRAGRKRMTNVPVAPSSGVWEQFLAVRNQLIDNPGPPEIGLRMAQLWDAIKASAAQNGAPVQCLQQ